MSITSGILIYGHYAGKGIMKASTKKLFTLKAGTVAMSAILTTAMPCKDLQNLQVFLLSPIMFMIFQEFKNMNRPDFGLYTC